MLDLSPEIAAIRPPDATALIARERREIFSIHPELRVLSWSGAILVATGTAMLLAKNYERIGPVAIAVAVAIASSLAYGYAVWRRRAGGPSVVDEYVLLLAALLLSADLAFIEGEFHLLDHGWPRHLLILAVFHAVAAYYFDSRTLLSLSITALAGWMGIEQRGESGLESGSQTAVRAIACAAVVVFWRGIDLRVRQSQGFARVFEHFAANLALLGAMSLMSEQKGAGMLLTVVFATAVVWHGFRVRSEAFVLYAYAYAFLAVTIFCAQRIGDDVLIMLFLVCASIAAIAGLFIVHREYRRRVA